jgi:hypothetical protein
MVADLGDLPFLRKRSICTTRRCDVDADAARLQHATDHVSIAADEHAAADSAADHDAAEDTVGAAAAPMAKESTLQPMHSPAAAQPPAAACARLEKRDGGDQVTGDVGSGIR